MANGRHCRLSALFLLSELAVENAGEELARAGESLPGPLCSLSRGLVPEPCRKPLHVTLGEASAAVLDTESCEASCSTCPLSGPCGAAGALVSGHGQDGSEGLRTSSREQVCAAVAAQAVALNVKLLSRQGKPEGSCHAVGAPPRGEAVGQGGSRDPGTSNGGAECRPPFSETRRWRAGGGGGLDLSGSILENLRPLILQLVKEAVAQALKDLVPGVGHSSVGPSAAPPGNQKPRKPGKGKGPGAPKQVAAGQAPPQNKGKGKEGKASGQDGDYRSQPAPEGRGGKGLASQAKGKGKMQPEPSRDQDGWTVVGRRKGVDADFQLDPDDWNAPVVSYDKLAAAIDNNADATPFRAVVLCSSSQAAVATTMARGSSHTCCITLIVLDKAGEASIPGKVAGQRRFMKGHLTEVSTKGGKAPQIQGKSKAVVVPKTDTTDTSCSWAVCSFMSQRLPLLIAAAGTGGGLGGLGFQVLSEVLRFGRIEGSHPVPSFTCPGPDLGDSSPPSLDLPLSLDFWSVCFGICCGLCLGPLLDLLFLIRHGWVRLVRSQARSVARGTNLYRILE